MRGSDRVASASLWNPPPPKGHPQYLGSGLSFRGRDCVPVQEQKLPRRTDTSSSSESEHCPHVTVVTVPPASSTWEGLLLSPWTWSSLLSPQKSSHCQVGGSLPERYMQVPWSGAYRTLRSTWAGKRAGPLLDTPRAGDPPGDSAFLPHTVRRSRAGPPCLRD